MKSSKIYLLVALLVIAAISFIVMVTGFFFSTSLTGFTAMWVFGVSSVALVFLCLPGSDDKGIVNYDTRLGL